MSKAVLAIVGVGVAVGAVVLIASTAKASTNSAPPPGPLQYGNATTVQGRSGNIWAVARVLNPGPVAAGVNVMAVFLLNPDGLGSSTPTIFYAQQGSDENARSFVSADPNAGNMAPTARADFGV